MNKRDATEEKPLFEGKKELVAASLIVPFVLGAFSGYLAAWHFNIKTPEETMRYVEGRINNPSGIHGLLRPQLTLEGAKNYYNTYTFISEGMLASELAKVCGWRQSKWSTQQISKLAKLNWSTACSGICTSSTEVKGFTAE